MSQLSGKSKFIAGTIILIAIFIAIYAGWQMLLPPHEETPPSGGGEQPPKPTEITLVVISRHGMDILKKAETAFLSSQIAKEYGIKDIWWLTPASHLWLGVIKNRGDVDVAWGGGPVLFDTLKNEGLLQPLKGKVLDLVNILPDEISGSPMKRFDDKGNILWVAAAISSFGFTINKDYLNTYNLPQPDEWIDLANETYGVTLPSPSVGVADATRSTSNTRMYQIILQRYGWVEGWKIITLMTANSAVFDQSESVRNAVMDGTIGVGITIDFYGYTAQLQVPSCKYILPKDGTIVNGDPIALLNTSKHVDAALAFIQWVLSPEGQKIWLDPNVNRLPINPEVFNTPEGKKRSDLQAQYNLTLQASTIEFSDELAISYENSLMWFFHATLVEPQDKLKDAWMALINAKENGKITTDEFKKLIDVMANPLKLNFTDPLTNSIKTFTLEYAQQINSMLLNPEFKTEITNSWRAAAEQKYNLVIQALQG